MLSFFFIRHTTADDDESNPTKPSQLSSLQHIRLKCFWERKKASWQAQEVTSSLIRHRIAPHVKSRRLVTERLPDLELIVVLLEFRLEAAHAVGKLQGIAEAVSREEAERKCANDGTESHA